MAEIIACPNCQRKVQVPEEYLGKLVQCPECKHQFTAAAAGTGVQTAPAPVPVPAPAWEKPRPSERADAEDDDRPRRKKRPRYDEDDDEDDDLDFGRSSRRRHLAPHRGGMILAFGIMSFAVCIIFGIMAWTMGTNDLREMRAGRMDPSGEGMTQAGRILGMIHTILFIVIVIGYCLLVAVMIATDKH